MLKIALVAVLLFVMLVVYKYGRSRYNIVRRRRDEILDRMRRQEDGD
jgi:hypothetical protein